MSTRPDVEVRVAEVARTSHGRLVALLASATRDLALAEDAVADAFERALTRWPDDGVPHNPEGWLFTVARNRVRDNLTSATARRTTALTDDDRSHGVLVDIDVDAIPDRRLELMYVCAHPAVDPAIRTPLMLNTVLGIEAAKIATAFAVPRATMAQRLVRAKRRIRDAGVPFSLPGKGDLVPRKQSVLEAVYAAYAIEWQVTGAEERTSLADESRYLAVLLASLLDDAEACGLASLISLAASRAGARERAGEAVPLDEQDTTRWDTGLVDDGRRLLARATELRRRDDAPIGRFQLEAAIQVAHAARADGAPVDHEGIARLTAALVSVAPTLGARVALAAARAAVDGPDAGLAVLDELDPSETARFQPAWATRAQLLADSGRTDEARTAWARAIDLTTDAPVRRRLERLRRDLDGGHEDPVLEPSSPGSPDAG